MGDPVNEPHDWQRWANNSVFEYYLNTWGWILVFVFIFSWLFETDYYSYSYSGNCSKRLVFVFVVGSFRQTESHWEFFLNTIHILLSIDTFDEWAHENLSLFWWLDQPILWKMSGGVFFFEYSVLPKVLCAPKLQFILMYQSHIGWVIWIGSCLYL